jgi:translation initiation factor 2 subunit 2
MSNYPYSYDELLYRLHNYKINENLQKKINLPQMEIKRVNKLSIFFNFDVYCEKLNRPLEHVANFFKTETGANISINGQNQLIIQNIINQTKCESIMKNYIKNFVMCKQCKGIVSSMIKKNGLTFLECNQCNAKTSMGKI